MWPSPERYGKALGWRHTGEAINAGEERRKEALTDRRADRERDIVNDVRGSGERIRQKGEQKAKSYLGKQGRLRSV